MIANILLEISASSIWQKLLVLTVEEIQLFSWYNCICPKTLKDLLVKSTEIKDSLTFFCIYSKFLDMEKEKIFHLLVTGNIKYLRISFKERHRNYEENCESYWKA